MFEALNFNKKKKVVVVRPIHADGPAVEKPQPTIPDGMWEKCPSCTQVLYADELAQRHKVCPKCGYHFRLSARQRIAFTVDEGSFEEMDAQMRGGNPLDFPGYDEKLRFARSMAGIEDAVIGGKATIGGHACIICAMDGFFMMGSMGEAVGEKLTRAIERATQERLPLIIFTVSGGARMQEGLVSLMQMARCSAALARHDDAGLLYVTVLTDPTTGGVTASFAMLGDIILAEPGTLVGFAGRRVIEQTVRQVLPEKFQRAEFLLEKGFVDAIVPRGELPGRLEAILALHEHEGGQGV